MPRSRCSRRRACSIVFAGPTGLGDLGGFAGEIGGGATRAIRLGRLTGFFEAFGRFTGLAGFLARGAERAPGFEGFRFDAAAAPRLGGGAMWKQNPPKQPKD